jgi:hypothetical protein
LYLKENEIRAWCEPRFEASFLTPEQLHNLLGIRLSKEEWTELFDLLLAGIAPGWLLQLPDSKVWLNFAPQTSPTSVLPTNVVEPSTDPFEPTTQGSSTPTNEVEILSPRFSESAVFLNGFPSLSFDENSQEDDVPYSTLTMEQIGDILLKFTKRFTSLKAKWTSAFSDVEANYLVVVKDLTDLQRFTNTVASSVGQPDPSHSHRNIWDHLKTLHTKAVEQFQTVMQSVNESTASVNAIAQDQTLLQSSVAAVEEVVTNTSASLQQRIHRVETTLQTFDSRFARLLPVLKHLQASKQPTPASPVPVATVLNQIQDLQFQVQKLQDTLWTQSLASTPPTSTTNDVDATLLDLKAQLKLLQVRIVGDGVQIGTRVFQSFEGVQAWVVSDLWQV